MLRRLPSVVQLLQRTSEVAADQDDAEFARRVSSVLDAFAAADERCVCDALQSRRKRGDDDASGVTGKDRATKSDDGRASSPEGRRRVAAKAAQKRALEAIAKQQASFAAMMLSSSDEDDDASETDDEDEESASNATKSRGGDSVAQKSSAVDDEEDLMCIMCRSNDAERASDLGYIAFLQPVRCMRVTDANAKCDRSMPPWERVSTLRGFTRPKTSVHIRFCGHKMHAACRDAYQASTLQRDDPLQHFRSANVASGEFLCPLCKTLSNALVPRPIRPRAAASRTDLSSTNDDKVEDVLRWIRATKTTTTTTSPPAPPSPSSRRITAQDFALLQSVAKLQSDHEGSDAPDGFDDAALTTLSPLRLVEQACRMLSTTVREDAVSSESKLDPRPMRALVSLLKRCKMLEMPVDLRDPVFSRRPRFDDVARSRMLELFTRGRCRTDKKDDGGGDDAVFATTPMPKYERILLAECPLALFAEASVLLSTSPRGANLLALLECVKVVRVVQVLIRGYLFAMEPSARPRFVRAKRVSGGSDDDDNDDDDETLPIAKLARELFAQLVPRAKKRMQCTRAFESNLRKNLGQALASLGKGIAALCQAGILDGVVASIDDFGDDAVERICARLTRSSDSLRVLVFDKWLSTKESRRLFGMW
eukprot:g1550.t1